MRRLVKRRVHASGVVIHWAAAECPHEKSFTIVQAAIEADCTKLYSEDMNAGQRLGSVVIVNPFKSS